MCSRSIKRSVSSDVSIIGGRSDKRSDRSQIISSLVGHRKYIRFYPGMKFEAIRRWK